MTSKTVFLTIIMLIGITPVIIIGIVQYKSKHPVGFWSGKKPPKEEQVTDVKAYNQKHGLMWILYGVGFILCYVCAFPFGEAVVGILCIIELAGGLLLMIAYHDKLVHMYCRRNNDM